MAALRSACAGTRSGPHVRSVVRFDPFRSAWARPVRDCMLLAGLVLLVLSPFLALAAGLDERSLLGRSPWDKPLRFALSLGVYAVTMVLAAQWLLARTRVWGWLWLLPVVVGALVFEMTWIVVQAARGVDSHFNDRTAFEDLMFGLMGVGAALLSLGAARLGVASLRLVLSAAAPKERLIASGIALGFVSTGPMLAWTVEALVDVNRSQTAIDAQVVLPVLGWRLDGSDPRPARFVAAHLMQALPLLAVWMAASERPQRQGLFFGILVCLTGCALVLTLWLLP